jgi:L-rhamnose mutarotase
MVKKYINVFLLTFGTVIGLASFQGCKQAPPKVTIDASAAPKQTKEKRPVIVEIIFPKDSVFDSHALYDLSKGFVEDIVQWQNRVVVYVNTASAEELIEGIKKEYHQPYDTIKVFDSPVYNFNRSRCADTVNSKEWDNIILTANLVNDSRMQQEYLDYHKTQFEKWPEVSKGFCNANFQQLLVFKNGRQLILVISIPKGASLDKLNPKTTENNPRVDEWNKIMKKYQEGLPGTKPGEVWVFLKPLIETKTEKDRALFLEGKSAKKGN